MGVALILFVGVDYKAFGTSKRFDAGSGDAQRFSSTSFPGMMPDVYQQLRANNDYRIVVRCGHRAAAQRFPAYRADHAARI